MTTGGMPAGHTVLIDPSSSKLVVIGSCGGRFIT